MTNKEAIEILKNYHNGYFGYKIADVHKAHNLAIKALEERPQGEWIMKNDYTFDCNLCGCSCLDKNNYCPDCDADMRG